MKGNVVRKKENLMKNQTILSLLTAGAIVATSAASFAAWDNTTGTATGKLNVANPVDIVSTPIADFTAGTRTLGAAPEYSSMVKFNVKSSSLVDTLSLSTVIKKADNTVVTDNFTVSYEQTGADNGLVGAVDSKIVDGDNDYTVKITPNDTTEARALAGSDLTVEVTGTLSKAGA